MNTDVSILFLRDVSEGLDQVKLISLGETSRLECLLSDYFNQSEKLKFLFKDLTHSKVYILYNFLFVRANTACV